jgi:hypothetical protein
MQIVACLVPDKRRLSARNVSMSASAGNLDPLFGAAVPAGDLYALQVQSYTTSGTGASERIATMTAVVGAANFLEGAAIQPTATTTVSLVDDTANTLTLTPGAGIDPNPQAFAPSYVLGFDPSAILISTLPSFDIALGLDSGMNQDVSLGIVSAAPLAPGTVIAFTAAGAYSGPLSLCFCAGTMIATATGETAVEDLAIGDTVLTASGEPKPVVWIGQGRVLVTPGRRSPATPVRICKGALDDGVPHRDLRVTKGHSLLLDGVLIPVEFLVNHRSIVWDDRAREVDIYHVELAGHDVLLANGAPAESYRDDGNRWLFRNADRDWDRPPQPPCAPLLTCGPLVDAVWRRLLDRAGPRPGFVLTDDPDLHLRIDGIRLNSASRHGSTYVFDLPRIPAAACIASHAAAPAELGLARDPRALGVAVRRIVLRQGARFEIIPASHAGLTRGFHDFEAANGFRWTNGQAALPATLFSRFDGPVELVLEIACTARYPLFGEAAAA